MGLLESVLSKLDDSVKKSTSKPGLSFNLPFSPITFVGFL